MSLKALSESTGFSVSTVSKVLSGKSEISENTREIIISKAKEMGVYEKYFHFKPGKYVIALIVPEFKSEYYADIISLFSEYLNGIGAVLTVSESGFNAECARDLFSYYAYGTRADGIIIMSDASLIKNPDKFPALVLGSKNSAHLLDCVEFDIENALLSLVRYLADNGHRDIGYIGEENTSAKNDYFVSAMRKLRLPVRDEFIKINALRFEESGYAAMNELLSQPSRPTAVIAAYDYIAIGAMKSISEHALSVPDDISIVGMDNIYAAETLSTPLTTVSISPLENTAILIDMLLKKIDNKYISLRPDTVVNYKIIERNSVKKIKAE